MKFWRLLLVLALATAGVGCASPGGRVPSTGLPGPCRIRGRVFDLLAHEKGREEPIAGAEVRLTGPALAGVRVTHTDATGAYSFPQIPPGRNYRVSASADGYMICGNPVILEGSQTVMMDVYLYAPGTIQFINADSTMLDYTQAN